jgi:predicted anti-sigma-YlaC factor YlaD
MSADRIADYNIRVVEQHLSQCESCTQELSRSSDTKERLDAKVIEGKPLTEDDVHQIVSPQKGEHP